MSFDLWELSLGKEEKIIEINITLDKPYVIAILLIIILFEAGYIGYLQFFRVSRAKNTGFELEGPENTVNTANGMSFNFTEPKNFDELKADLIAVGVKKIIDIEVKDLQGKHLEANYTTALKLAKEASFICVNENVLAFMLYLDGELLIWFPR